MDRLASHLRSSPRGRIRWSLRKLAELGQRYSPNEQVPSSATAGMLLHDVSLRLADQYSLCKQLASTVKNVQNVKDRPQSRQSGRVIRAVNHPVHLDWKQAQEQQETTMLITKKAQRNLHNLEMLHDDTFHLAYELLDSSVLSRFQNADRHVVFSTFEQIRSRHASTVEDLADIVIGVRSIDSENNDLDGLVEKFQRGRLGVQLLCDHFVALHKGKPNGGVALDCRLMDVVDDAVTESRHVCDAHYQKSPEIFVGGSDLKISLIRPWVHHALVELLKNAMAASMKVCAQDECPPPIQMQLDQDSDFVFIHIMDEGVGVSSVEEAFQFASSSSHKRWDRLEEQQSYAMVRSPLQSLGVGLYKSRLLMQHFGGNVMLQNHEKCAGCTATIHLYKDNSFLERLPG